MGNLTFFSVFKVKTSPILLACAGFMFSCKPSTENISGLSSAEKEVIKQKLDMNLQASVQKLGNYQDSPAYSTIVANAHGVTSANPNDSLAITGGFNVGQSFKNLLDQALKKTGGSVCGILKPFLGDGSYNKIRKPYFFVGQSFSGGAGVKGVVGIDLVWDLYNLQFSAFKFGGVEATVGAGAIGGGASTYIGAAFGKGANVMEAWSGNFISSSITGSLPILADYLSIGANGFVSSDGLKPNYNIMGAALVFQVGLSVPTAAPVGVTVQSAKWFTDKDLNTNIAGLWKKMGIPLSTRGPFTCDGNCIRIDSPNTQGASYTSRSMALLNSIPVLAASPGSRFFPGFGELSVLALATGAFRDMANSAQACGFK